MEEQLSDEEIYAEHDRRQREAIEANGHDAEPRPPEYSDDALGLRFADAHAPRLRYVAAWGKWFFWDGRY